MTDKEFRERVQEAYTRYCLSDKPVEDSRLYLAIEIGQLLGKVNEMRPNDTDVRDIRLGLIQ